MRWGVVGFERVGVVGEQYDDEVGDEPLQVRDEVDQSVTVDHFQGVQQHERDSLVDVVNEIARERNDQSHEFPFALAEVVETVLVGIPSLSPAPREPRVPPRRPAHDRP